MTSDSTPMGGGSKLSLPATISFGQNLRAEAAAGNCDGILAFGSTLSVYPAAGIPLAAAERGVPYAIVNRGAMDHDRHPGVVLRLEGDMVALLPPAVEAALRG